MNVSDQILRAWALLADPSFISSFDEEPPGLQTRNSATGIVGLDFYTDEGRRMWRVRFSAGAGYRCAARRNLDDALELWAQRTGGNIQQARELLQSRGLV